MLHGNTDSPSSRRSRQWPRAKNLGKPLSASVNEQQLLIIIYENAKIKICPGRQKPMGETSLFSNVVLMHYLLKNWWRVEYLPKVPTLICLLLLKKITFRKPMNYEKFSKSTSLSDNSECVVVNYFVTGPREMSTRS